MTPSPASIDADVEALLRSVLALPAATPAPLRRADLEQWDSLKHMDIVLALEDRFDVQFHEDEFAALDSTAAIASAVRRHLAT